MAEVARIYNTLPSLVDADEHFTDRESMLRNIAALLAQYEYTFGLCLVHSHCKLVDGEIMVAQGNVSEPLLTEHAPAVFPERWLSNGVPYEFTVRKTTSPPQQLIDEFQRIVQQAKLQDFLGLYHIDGEKDAPAIIEWTDGRKNLTREITDDDKTGEPIQTAWDFGRGDPVTMSCTIYCDQLTTRTSSSHKGSRSHIKQ